MRIAIYVILGGVFAFASVSLLTAIFTCHPISAWWEYGIFSDKCIDFIDVSKAVAALNISTDLAIIILPLPGLKSLMLPLTQKIALMAVYALGTLYVLFFFWVFYFSGLTKCLIFLDLAFAS